MINPLWGEADEAKRIAGWKAVSKYIADNGLRDPAAAVRPADRACAGRGRAARLGRAAAASDEAGPEVALAEPP
jgi:hypothetical protein